MSYDQGHDTSPFFADFEKGLDSFHHRSIGEEKIKCEINL